MVQMDFAKIFSVKQLMKFNLPTGMPHQLHFILSWLIIGRQRGVRELLDHNFVFVSDFYHHNSTAVFAILQQLVPTLKEYCPGITDIHYWTDSPSSKYRNRFILHIIGNHFQLFGGKARWNYFETGHGIGPCDGIGGTCKRRASEAVKQGKTTIQDAKDFFN